MINRYLEPYIEGQIYDDIRLSDTNIIVRGDVRLDGINLTNLPHYKYVSSGFCCDANQLTSLDGCPIYVGGRFWCRNNKLTSLKYCPTYIGRNFYCDSNKVKLKCPASITIMGEFINEY